MTYDLNRMISLAVRHGPDMTKPEVTGDYQPPAKGIACARLVGYFELGTHEEEFEGKKRDREKVDLVFELSGPNHEPEIRNGMRVPIRVTAQETLDLRENANFLKLFGAMNYAGKATHMAELLGEAFIVEVFHKVSADGKKTYANLKGPSGYNVKGPVVQDALPERWSTYR